jgi:hypothetical protein
MADSLAIVFMWREFRKIQISEGKWVTGADVRNWENIWVIFVWKLLANGLEFGETCVGSKRFSLITAMSLERSPPAIAFAFNRITANGSVWRKKITQLLNVAFAIEHPRSLWGKRSPAHSRSFAKHLATDFLQSTGGTKNAVDRGFARISNYHSLRAVCYVDRR